MKFGDGQVSPLIGAHATVPEFAEQLPKMNEAGFKRE
jgi:hypothetical protein